MTIKMYTTPFCKYCKVAKEFFKTKNISFTEVDITKDDKAMKEMMSKSQQMSVPVFDIDGEILVGFNRTKLEKAIKVA
ncbi:MAG: NrdH-redoxin [Candidatus Colwellbacteria bacterium CG10_big_fil_rev_8_21_14_0_10_42_22]|uniref:NrdH-redoxin n=1 Tax=Candidatus Colwellbacteria bacterium CG10_big_fil_rev_8_21_14_0_10_42_22 TaxID=1974540 RepID=A0A2H0VGI5_9BACT|nr:MAG: NrdH-redoxin [Candidatus Colwellbacteria bacterium CG10_big_fil_rev_8_21_14_0_10_42_22]